MVRTSHSVGEASFSSSHLIILLEEHQATSLLVFIRQYIFLGCVSIVSRAQSIGLGSQLARFLSPQPASARPLSSANEIKSAWLATQPGFPFPAFVSSVFYQKHHGGVCYRSKTRGKWARKMKCLDMLLKGKIIFFHSSQNLIMLIFFF